MKRDGLGSKLEIGYGQLGSPDSVEVMVGLSYIYNQGEIDPRISLSTPYIRDLRGVLTA